MIGIGLGIGFANRSRGGAPFSWGYDPNFDAGTDGDLIVAKNGNDATGTGTLAAPYLTIVAAVTAATAPAKVQVRSGTYREKIPTKAGITVARYGTEQPIITGGEIVDSFVPCVSGDATYVGSGWANLSKSSPIPIASIAGGSAEAAFLCEAGNPMQIAIDQPENPEHPMHLDVVRDWHTADVVNLASGFIQSYENSDVTDAYTQAQIEAASILLYGSPNLSYYDKVASFTAGAIVLTTTGTYLPQTGTPFDDNFALVNILPAIKRGGWGYRIDGTDVILYVWPTDADNLPAGITYTAREMGAEPTSNSALVGLRFEQFATYDLNNVGLQKTAIQTAASGDKKTNVTVRHCLIKNTAAIGARGTAPIYFRNVDRALIEQNTIENAFGLFGIFLQGGTIEGMAPADDRDESVDWANEGLIRRNRMVNVGHSPLRTFTVRDTAILNNKVVKAAFAAHAGPLSAYVHCHNVLTKGNDMSGADGYATDQTGSAMHWVGNYIPASYLDNDGRAFRVQPLTDYKTPAEAFGLPADALIANNTLPPSFGDLDQTNAMGLGGAPNPELTYTILNNISHGISVFSTPTARTNNYDSASLSTDINIAVGDLYQDANNADLTIKAGAAVRDVTGTSILARLTSIIATMPQTSMADMLFDVNGDAFDPDSPPIGAATAIDVQSAPLFVTQPTLSGAAISGSVLTASDAIIMGQPRPTLTNQFEVETSGIWAAMPGETGATLTIPATAIGKRIRRATSAGDVVVYTDSTAAVASVFPISVPVLIGNKVEAALNNFSAAPVQTITGIVSDGSPIFVYAYFKFNSAPSMTSVTLGGDAMTLVNEVNRSNGVTIFVYKLDAPAVGTLSAVLTSAVNYISMFADAFRVTGATGTANIVETGVSSGTSLAINGVTTTANSMLLHFWIGAGSDGDDAVSEVTITGATEILENSIIRGGSPNQFYDVTGTIAYVEATSPGTFPITATTTRSGSQASFTVELLS